MAYLKGTRQELYSYILPSHPPPVHGSDAMTVPSALQESPTSPVVLFESPALLAMMLAKHFAMQLFHVDAFAASIFAANSLIYAGNQYDGYDLLAQLSPGLHENPL